MRIKEALPGTRVGKLTIQSTYQPRGTTVHKRRNRAVCVCDCGNTVDSAVINLGPDTNSCGCLKTPIVRQAACVTPYIPSTKINLVGSRFSKLTVTSLLKSGEWECRCDCGNTIARSTGYLNYHASSRQSCKRCAQRLNRTKSPGEGSWKVYYNNYRRGAEKRNLRFDLNLQQFKDICGQNCYYGGESPRQYNKYSSEQALAKGVDPETLANGWILINGIDRLDSSIGYIQGNIVPCCSRCNYAKLDRSEEEFLQTVKSIYEHRNLGNL